MTIVRPRTYIPSQAEIDASSKWYLVDAEGAVLGRLASRIAAILHGKNKPYFTPHLDTGDRIVVINAEKIVLTGNKLLKKTYYRHSGYPGGLRAVSAERMLSEHPDRVILLAVKRMLPRNRLGRKLLKNLRVYAGSEHPHKAQSPEALDLQAALQEAK